MDDIKHKHVCKHMQNTQIQIILHIISHSTRSGEDFFQPNYQYFSYFYMKAYVMGTH